MLRFLLFDENLPGVCQCVSPKLFILAYAKTLTLAVHIDQHGGCSHLTRSAVRGMLVTVVYHYIALLWHIKPSIEFFADFNAVYIILTEECQRMRRAGYAIRAAIGPFNQPNAVFSVGITQPRLTVIDVICQPIKVEVVNVALCC